MMNKYKFRHRNVEKNVNYYWGCNSIKRAFDILIHAFELAFIRQKGENTND